MGMVASIVAMLALAAGPAWQRARLTEEQLAFGHRAADLGDAAQAQWKAGRKAEAVAALEKGRAMIESLAGRDSFQHHLALAKLARWEAERERWEAVAALKCRMAGIQEALWGRDHWKAADARREAADAAADVKRTPERRKALRLAHGLNVVAIEVHEQGMYDQVPRLLEKAMATFKKEVGERHPAYALSLNTLAEAKARLGEYESARRVLEEASAIVAETCGRKHPNYATCLNNLAGHLHAMGRDRAALPLFERSLAIRRAVLPEGHPTIAVSLNNLATVHISLGDRRTARRLYERALALQREAGAPGSAALGGLALLLSEAGDHAAALPLAKEALEIDRKAIGERHPLYAASLNNLASLHAAAGDLKSARPLQEKALALLKRHLGERHPDYAACLANLAKLLQDLGDAKGACPLMEKALRLKKELLGERHPRVARSLNNLALLLDGLGERERGLALMEQALALVAAQLRDNAAAQSDRQLLAAADAARLVLSNRLLLPDGGKHPLAAAHVLEWKGQLLARQAQRRTHLRLAGDGRTRAAAQRLQAATRRLAALRHSPAATREKLEALEKEQEEAQAALALLSADYRARRAEERAGPAELAASLPEATTLVDYQLYHDRLAAFVHRKGGRPVRVDLGSTAPIAKAVDRWRAALHGRLPEASLGAKLKALVWTPLEKRLAGAKTVLVSPDGILGTVPFAALPGKEEGTYLIEDVALAIVPAPSAIPALLKPLDDKDRHPPSLLVVGDADYSSAKAGAASALSRSAPLGFERRWSALPGAAAEARSVSASFADRFGPSSVVALSGTGAGKAATLEALGRARYAHLATHGYFAPETVRSASRRKRDPLQPEEIDGWHPLLLSGLALAGANRVPKEGEEDGILTALEVSETDLTRLELCVLSACETGLGPVAGGEGLLGMQRAFQAAGARSVVASLWQVSDGATQELMSDFARLAWDPKRKASLASALREAQLAMMRGEGADGRTRGPGKAVKVGEGRAARLHPFYWAAFVLSGDWR
ncbi:MAG: CHAT domain-containing protein [Gemmataceae bacterium]|nr:CHAT domain-containing protein [Gemmataceae bacterium]